MDKNVTKSKPSTKTKVIRGTKKGAEVLLPCKPVYDPR